MNTILANAFTPFIQGVENIQEGFNNNTLSTSARIVRIAVGIFELIPFVNYIVYKLSQHLFTTELADPSNLDFSTQVSIAEGNRGKIAKEMNLVGLVHKVAIQSFSEIFKSGKLLPSKKSSSKIGIRTPVIFLQAITPSMLDNPNILQYWLFTDTEKNKMGINFDDPVITNLSFEFM